jgi:hypothetical protein
MSETNRPVLERCVQCEHHRRGSCAARFAHSEPPAECARDELVTFCVERGLEPGDVEWLLAWAHRRYAHQISAAEEGLLLVAAGGENADISSLARATLRRMGMSREEISKSTDPGPALPKVGAMGYGHE